MDSQVSSQVHASRNKKHFKADYPLSLANDRLMDVTQLALTWVGWPNGDKLAQRKCTQGLAKRSCLPNLLKINSHCLQMSKINFTQDHFFRAIFGEISSSLH